MSGKYVFIPAFKKLEQGGRARLRGLAPICACNACGSASIAFAGALAAPGGYDQASLPVIYCRDCGTLHTPVIREDNDSHLAWHLSVEQRNRKACAILLNEIIEFIGRTPQGVIDIGCGPGWLLDEARKLDIATYGYDTDAEVIAFGREKLGLRLESALFDPATAPAADIVFCMSVLEHLGNPNVLFSQIASFCVAHSALACVAVPLSANTLKYQYDAESSDSGNPFNQLPQHVIHFTPRGLQALITRHGGEIIQYPARNGLFTARLIKFDS